MSRDLDHLRQPGHLSAWQVLNARVAEDLQLRRGDIKPARSRCPEYHARLHTLSQRVKDQIADAARRLMRIA